MRAIWTGALSFGLINIPIRLYSAAQDRPLKFKQLEKGTLCPIGYLRVCKATGKEVKYENIVKGYEYEKGDYVVMHDDDFRKVIRMAKTIDIVRFSDETDIDAKYYEKPYYVEPEKTATKAYALLRDALKRSGKVAIATMVLRNRERLAVLKPEGDALMINQIRFQDEIVPTNELHIPGKEKYTAKEIDMAMSLIDHLSEHFDASDFKDEYTRHLQKVIEQRKKGKKPKAEPEVELTKMKDLMTALRESLERETAHARR